MVLLNFDANIESMVLPEEVMRKYDGMSPEQFIDNLRFLGKEERAIAGDYLVQLEGWRLTQIIMFGEKRGMFDRKYFCFG